MFKYIERLQNESEPHRKRTALAAAFSLTGIIFVGWFMAFSAGSSVSYEQGAASATSSPMAAVGEALKTGGALIGDLIRSFQESKKLIFEAASSTASTTLEFR